MTGPSPFLGGLYLNQKVEAKYKIASTKMGLGQFRSWELCRVFP